MSGYERDFIQILAFGLGAGALIILPILVVQCFTKRHGGGPPH